MFRRKQRGASPRVIKVPGQWKVVWGPRLRWLGVLIALVSLTVGFYAGGQWLLAPSRFPLRHVRIQGELRNLEQSDVQRVVQAYLGQNFFALDIDALHAAFMAEPWIESVAVRRLWPDSLEVRVRERIAFGYWGQREMVDINGKRFHPNVLRQPGPWPQLVGPDGHERNLIRVWKEAGALLDKADLKLVRLVLDQRRAWSLQVANGIKVNLGKDNFIQRLRRFVDLYPRVLAAQSDRIAVVDLRYTNGFAVRWANPPGTNAAVRNQPQVDKPVEQVHPQASVSMNSAG